MTDGRRQKSADRILKSELFDCGFQISDLGLRKMNVIDLNLFAKYILSQIRDLPTVSTVLKNH
jgi:hypothetical protein